MGLITITNSKAYVGKLENYLKQPEKTSEELMYGVGVDPFNISGGFRDTKQRFRKTDGRRYYHVVQSFSPDDNVDPKTANEIGIDLAEKEFGDKGFEVAVITHTDKGHIHNHLVINSVNARTGKKFRSKAKDLWAIKETSNELCREYGLEHSVIDHSERTTSYDRGEYESVKRGNSWKAAIIQDVQHVLQKQPLSMEELIRDLEDQGYEIRYEKEHKTMTFTSPKGKKVRGRTLTKSYEDLDFSKGALENEIKRYQTRTNEWKDFSQEFEEIRETESRDSSKEHELDRQDENREQRTESSVDRGEERQRDKKGKSRQNDRGHEITR